jgi:hypothetical protein
MREKVIASNNWEKMISGTPYGEKNPVKITVTAKLYTLGDNDYPYFSITGDIKKMDKRYRNPYIMSGCIHEEILKYFPHLSPLVNVHLSAPDGLPMHAEANARYWAGLSKWADGRPMSPRDEYGRITVETDENGLEWAPVTLASHLRVSEQQAREIRSAMVSGLPWETITKHAKLTELWSDQAGKARALLNSHELAVSNA